MKCLEEIKGEAIIIRLSEQHAIPRKEIEAAIQETIDEAWNSNDPVSHELQRKLFRGKKPSPALFISRIAQYVKNNPRP